MSIGEHRFIRSVTLLRDRVESFEEYPFSIPAIRNLDTLDLDARVTFLVGENGSGKSTLLEAIAVAADLNPEGGTTGLRFETRTSHSELYASLRLSRGLDRPATSFFLRAESFFNVATALERLPDESLRPYGGRSLHDQSHGESFLALLKHRFGPRGLYLLDEPEAALSFTGQLALLRRLHDLVEEGSQFIVASHSPILMGFPSARIYLLDEDGFEQAAWQETDHYLLTRDFLEDRDRFIRHLFGE